MQTEWWREKRIRWLGGGVGDVDSEGWSRFGDSSQGLYVCVLLVYGIWLEEGLKE